MSGIRAHADRLRGQSRLQTITAMLPSERYKVGGKDLWLTNIRATDTVAPGGNVTVEVELTNSANYISNLEGTACHNRPECSSAAISNGYCAHVELTYPGGTEATDKCVPLKSFGYNRETVTFTITAPEGEGYYDVSATLSLNGPVDDVTDPRTATFEVVEDADYDPGFGGGSGSQCQQNEDCEEGYVCKGGKCASCGPIDKLTNPGQCGVGGGDGGGVGMLQLIGGGLVLVLAAFAVGSIK